MGVGSQDLFSIANRYKTHDHFWILQIRIDICVSRLTSIGSDNGLSPSRGQVIIWTNAEIVLIRTLVTNFSEIISGIHTFLYKTIHLKMSSAKWRRFCLGVNVLIYPHHHPHDICVPRQPNQFYPYWIRKVLTTCNVRFSGDQLKRRIFNITPHETLRCSLILWYILATFYGLTYHNEHYINMFLA